MMIMENIGYKFWGNQIEGGSKSRHSLTLINTEL
jgi:hypothetical protein